MAMLSLATLLILFVSSNADRYIESISANFNNHHHGSASHTTPKSHEKFVPLVAFQCGYRNKFLNNKGEWQDDPSSTASCLHGKYNILKYCRRVYPDMAEKINNIVDYSHLSKIDNWCKEDGSDCHSIFTVRAYRCLVGEFITESLQVPNKCHFSHIAGKNECNDFKYWNNRAEQQCNNKIEEGTHKPMKLHSFAILEPCGIDMFRGVEYVCCPKDVDEKLKNFQELEPKLPETDVEEDDEDDYNDDDEDEDDTSTSKTIVEQDPYFKDNLTANEHDRFRDAIERLERKHRKRVTKIITQWSELFEKYNKMKKVDPKGADDYKREMNAKFRKTIGALEDENREQRKQIEELHNERVQTALNEKKRQATHDYRQALALQVGQDNKEKVLHTLKAYIKAEEKDRTHMLARYRHLLRSDKQGAEQYEPVLLHRLRYIDLRINGTMAMLHDFPTLEKEIRPIAEKFWKDFRHENTPEGAELDNQVYLSDDERNERLIRFYKKTFEKGDTASDLELVEPEDLLKKSKPSVSKSDLKGTMVALKDVLSEKGDEDSDEDQFDDGEDDLPIKSSSVKVTDLKAEDIRVEFLKETAQNVGKGQKKETVFKVPIKVKGKAEQKPAATESTKDDDDSSDEDDSDEAESQYSESNSKKGENDGERELHIAVEPIILSPGKEDIIVTEIEGTDMNKWANQSNFIILSTVITLFIILLIIRHRRRHRGFIEVEIHNPDDKIPHINPMQARGYENPTFKFFEKQP